MENIFIVSLRHKSRYIFFVFFFVRLLFFLGIDRLSGSQNARHLTTSGRSIFAIGSITPMCIESFDRVSTTPKNDGAPGARLWSRSVEKNIPRDAVSFQADDDRTILRDPPRDVIPDLFYFSYFFLSTYVCPRSAKKIK